MTPLLEIRNLQKSFHQGNKKLEILKGLNLTVSKGDSIAILGESGSGKTTLLSLLTGLDRPDQGEITIQNTSIIDLDEEALSKFRSKNMGIVFQKYHLFSHLNTLENVALPLQVMKKADALEIAREALNSVGLGERLNHYPAQLSGGESQRVGIARAVAINPKILFADEPTGSLDEETGAVVSDLLFELAEKYKTTLVLVTHSRTLSERCNRVLHLKHGLLTNAN